VAPSLPLSPDLSPGTHRFSEEWKIDCAIASGKMRIILWSHGKSDERKSTPPNQSLLAERSSS
jgi:hypothetical protein